MQNQSIVKHLAELMCRIEGLTDYGYTEEKKCDKKVYIDDFPVGFCSDGLSDEDKVLMSLLIYSPEYGVTTKSLMKCYGWDKNYTRYILSKLKDGGYIYSDFLFNPDEGTFAGRGYMIAPYIYNEAQKMHSEKFQKH